MTSRKPPSQRDPSYVVKRMHRTLQSMSPGTMGGRVANAAPIAFGSAVSNPIASSGGDSSAASWVLDRFVASSSTQTQYQLSYVPDSNGLFLFLNGLLLDEGVDFTCDYTTGLVTLLF